MKLTALILYCLLFGAGALMKHSKPANTNQLTEALVETGTGCSMVGLVGTSTCGPTCTSPCQLTALVETGTGCPMVGLVGTST